MTDTPARLLSLLSLLQHELPDLIDHLREMAARTVRGTT